MSNNSTTHLVLNRAARIKNATGEFVRLKTAKQEWIKPTDLVPNQVTVNGVGVTHNGNPVTHTP